MTSVKIVSTVESSSAARVFDGLRGTFTAAFFFQCMDAIGCKTIHLGADE